LGKKHCFSIIAIGFQEIKNPGEAEVFDAPQGKAKIKENAYN